MLVDWKKRYRKDQQDRNCKSRKVPLRRTFFPCNASGSTVTGIIRDDKDAVDAVDAILPAGTLSGAPKFRACQIIEELEQSKRGIYGGAIGYLDFAGNLDTCIAIRLVYKKNGEICIRSGAGIVADSVPEKEFQECCNKARAVYRQLNRHRRD